MKIRNLSTFALSSAVAGILAGATLGASCSGNATAAGKTAEKAEHNGCNGKNSCGGKGGCAVPPAEKKNP